VTIGHTKFPSVSEICLSAGEDGDAAPATSPAARHLTINRDVLSVVMI